MAMNLDISDQAIQVMERFLDGIRDDIRAFWAYSESPIEQLMAVSLYFWTLWASSSSGSVIDIAPQAIVPTQLGKFRVDFLVREKKSCRSLAIECDGFDYHERTREQAESDRQRDRALLEAGIPVLRFLGSEIRRDPSQCGKQAIEAVMRLAGLGPANGDRVRLGQQSNQIGVAPEQ